MIYARVTPISLPQRIFIENKMCHYETVCIVTLIFTWGVYFYDSIFNVYFQVLLKYSVTRVVLMLL